MLITEPRKNGLLISCCSSEPSIRDSPFRRSASMRVTSKNTGSDYLNIARKGGHHKGWFLGASPGSNNNGIYIALIHRCSKRLSLLGGCTFGRSFFLCPIFCFLLSCKFGFFLQSVYCGSYFLNHSATLH